MEREWGAGASFLPGHPSAADSGGEDVVFRDGLHGGVRDAAAWERGRGQADDGLPRSRGASVGRGRDGLEPAAREVMVVYAPMILRSLAEIKEAFGVGERQIKLWVQQGAPIAVEGEGRKVRYSAEAVRLQVWRERKCLMLE